MKKPKRTSLGLNRRAFITAAASGGILLPAVAGRVKADTNHSAGPATVTDFSRSFCYCSPKPGAIWVRIQLECRCEVFDPAGGKPEEYVLGVKAQTGLHREPERDPGYDFWVIFSKKYVYNKRGHASSYNNNPDRVPVDQYGPVGWHLQPCRAMPLRSAGDVRAALQKWRPIVARTEFAGRGGAPAFAIEYPVKWADFSQKEEGFRVETGPVILIDTERARGLRELEFDDFRWAHLDYHSFDRARCILERPTPILAGASLPQSARTPQRNSALTPAQVAQVEKRLFSGWRPPVPFPALRRLFETDHYSIAVRLPVTTTMYALDQPCPAG